MRHDIFAFGTDVTQTPFDVVAAQFALLLRRADPRVRPAWLDGRGGQRLT